VEHVSKRWAYACLIKGEETAPHNRTRAPCQNTPAYNHLPIIGNRPANPPTHRLALLTLHNIPNPTINQHPSVQAASLRSTPPLLGFRSVPRSPRARERPSLNPHAPGQSLPQPLRRCCNRREAARPGALPQDCGWTSVVADWKSGAGRVCAR
jgi:hypothetical protein